MSITTLLCQSYSTTNVTTEFTSSSKMIRNYTTKEFDFSNNDDMREFHVDWVFRVNSENKGIITSNSVNYDILEYKLIDDKTVVITVLNLKVQREMKMFLTKSDNSFVISVVDEPNRNVFYFFQ